MHAERPAPQEDARAGAFHVALAPGESLLPEARKALAALGSDPAVQAVLLPLAPQGEHALARAARRYLRAWDGRLHHAQNYYAPAARVASRAPLPGPRNAQAAPVLENALASGGRVEALQGPAVATRIADDLSAWAGHFRAEGAAWGALARADARFAGFVPALSRAAWWRHNVARAPRRVIESAEAARSLAPLVITLHMVREAAFSGGTSLSQPSSREAHG